MGGTRPAYPPECREPEELARPRVAEQLWTGRALEEITSGPVERITPGVPALLNGAREDRSHVLLDLGAAADSGLRACSRFARRVRFADLLGEGRSHGTARPSSTLPP